MRNFNAVMMSLMYIVDGQRIEIKKIIYVPESYTCLPKKELLSELRKLLNINNSDIYIIAHKYGNISKSNTGNCLEIVLGKTDFESTTDWYVNALFDDLELYTIDKLADPCILLYGYDKRTLRYKLTYYVDLVSQGYSCEKALEEILS